MTVEEARSILEKKFPDRKVSGSYKFGKDYLFSASKKGVNPMDDYTNPFFIVNSSNGKIRGFSPTEDLTRFGMATLKPL